MTLTEVIGKRIAYANKFTPLVGGSATGNGMYLPAANTVAISTNNQEQVRVTSGGNLGVGTQNPLSIIDAYRSSFAAIGISSDTTASILVTQSTNDLTSGAVNLIKSRGTVSAKTPVISGDNCGRVTFWGQESPTQRQPAAQIYAFIDGTPGVNDMPGALVFATTKSGQNSPVASMTINNLGNVGINTSSQVNKLQIVGSFGRGAPVTKTLDFTLADTENWIIVNKGSSCTITLPAASNWLGREFTIKVITAHTVVSASSNVVPANSETAGTAILSASAGAWATLVSNGANWIIMANS